MGIFLVAAALLVKTCTIKAQIPQPLQLLQPVQQVQPQPLSSALGQLLLDLVNFKVKWLRQQFGINATPPGHPFTSTMVTSVSGYTNPQGPSYSASPTYSTPLYQNGLPHQYAHVSPNHHLHVHQQPISQVPPIAFHHSPGQVPQQWPSPYPGSPSVPQSPQLVVQPLAQSHNFQQPSTDSLATHHSSPQQPGQQNISPLQTPTQQYPTPPEIPPQQMPSSSLPPQQLPSSSLPPQQLPHLPLKPQQSPLLQTPSQNNAEASTPVGSGLPIDSTGQALSQVPTAVHPANPLSPSQSGSLIPSTVLPQVDYLPDMGENVQPFQLSIPQITKPELLNPLTSEVSPTKPPTLPSAESIKPPKMPTSLSSQPAASKVPPIVQTPQPLSIASSPNPLAPLPPAPLAAAPLPTAPQPPAPLPSALLPPVPLPSAPLSSAPLPSAPLPPAPQPPVPLPSAPLPLPPAPQPPVPLPSAPLPSAPLAHAPQPPAPQPPAPLPPAPQSTPQLPPSSLTPAPAPLPTSRPAYSYNQFLSMTPPSPLSDLDAYKK